MNVSIGRRWEGFVEGLSKAAADSGSAANTPGRPRPELRPDIRITRQHRSPSTGPASGWPPCP